MSEAKADCSDNTKCYGIYDEFCDNKGPFFICGYTNKVYKSYSSCIYAKGNNLLMCTVVWNQLLKLNYSKPELRNKVKYHLFLESTLDYRGK